MSNLNEIFMGGSKGSNQSGSSDSGSCSDSSSSDDQNRHKSKKKANKTRKGIDTPIGRNELEPDAFRGAMNPDIVQANANRDNNSDQHLGEQVWKMAELLLVLATILMTFLLEMLQKI